MPSYTRAYLKGLRKAKTPENSAAMAVKLRVSQDDLERIKYVAEYVINAVKGTAKHTNKTRNEEDLNHELETVGVDIEDVIRYLKLVFPDSRVYEDEEYYGVIIVDWS